MPPSRTLEMQSFKELVGRGRQERLAPRMTTPATLSRGALIGEVGWSSPAITHIHGGYWSEFLPWALGQAKATTIMAEGEKTNLKARVWEVVIFVLLSSFIFVFGERKEGLLNNICKSFACLFFFFSNQSAMFLNNHFFPLYFHAAWDDTLSATKQQH